MESSSYPTRRLQLKRFLGITLTPSTTPAGVSCKNVHTAPKSPAKMSRITVFHNSWLKSQLPSKPKHCKQWEINWFHSTHCHLNKFINCDVYFFHPAYCWCLWCTFAASPRICRLDVFLVDRYEINSLVENRLMLAHSCQLCESRCPWQKCNFAGVERLLSHDCCYKRKLLDSSRVPSHTLYHISFTCAVLPHTRHSLSSHRKLI